MLKKREITLLVGLVIIFAMAFAACGETGGLEDLKDLEVIYGPEVDGKTYKIGDEGQADGIIFYVSQTGFLNTHTQEINYYLEAAGNMFHLEYKWQTSNTNVSTGTAIGTGRENTRLIILADEEAEAAKACANFGSDLDNWFLPSIEELKELFRFLDEEESSIYLENSYWSSSQSSNTQALYYNTETKNQAAGDKGTGLLVHPIRSF